MSAVNPLRSIARGFADTGIAFRNEMHVIIRDFGVMLFFLFLPLAYPIVYTVIYNPEVVDNLPVAVVDHSRTRESRELARKVNATPELNVFAYASDLGEARRLWAERKVFGVLEIPADYARRIHRGEQAHATYYSDMSLLLRYRAALSALTSVQLDLGTEITRERINTVGLPGQNLSATPVGLDTNFLGATQQGFASFIMPGIVILILQQSMVLGICLIAGTSRERLDRGRPDACDRADLRLGPVAATLGKALAYVVFYAPATLYILHYVPVWFNLPHAGSAVQWLLFVVPFLLASAMFGLTLAPLMRRREDCFIYIVFTSVVFLFLSGLTWPRYAMSGLWHSIADTVPATWGVEGFVRINSNAGTLAQQSTPYLWLWGLAAAYFLTAVVLRGLQRRKRAASRAGNKMQQSL